jgi:hypothetical protein
MARKKNSAAVALGRLGGKKGGKARMGALTPKERSALGKLAAEAKTAQARMTKKAAAELRRHLGKRTPVTQGIPL